MKYYLGLDPGKQGGIAIIEADNLRRVRSTRALPIPTTQDGVLVEKITSRFLADTTGHETVGVIEKVWSSPQQGVASAFSFGRSYGMLRAYLHAYFVRFTAVTPQTWMGCLGLGSKRELKEELGLQDKQVDAAWKQYLLDTAKAWFPQLPN